MAARQALVAPRFSGCRSPNWGPGASSWENQEVQDNLRYFLWIGGRDLEVLHSREPVGEAKSHMAILSFLSVTLLWLLAGGLGNTCCGYQGPWIGLGYGKLRAQIVTINKNNLPWPMKGSFSWHL